MRVGQSPGSWPRILPADEQAPLPLQPPKEPLDKPAALIAGEGGAVLGLEFPSSPVRSDHVHAGWLQIIIDPVAVIGAIANEEFRLGLQHVEIKTQLHQCHIMMIGRMRAHRKRQPMANHNCENLDTFATAGIANPVAAFGRGKRRIDEVLTFIERAFLAQHLALVPLLKSTMHRFVVGVALRQQVLLRARVQYPKHAFKTARAEDSLRSGGFSGCVPRETVPEFVPVGRHVMQHEGALWQVCSSIQPC